MGGGRGATVCGEEGVGELEEGVSPGVEAFVERAAEGAKSIGRFHDAPIMRSPRVSRTPYPAPSVKTQAKKVGRKGLLRRPIHQDR